MTTSLPDMMDCIEISAPGGPEVLQLARRPLPSMGPGDVLIRVEAAGVNRPDVSQRQGNYPPPPGASDLPGLEIAGTIAAIGAGVSGFSVGDRVCALANGGGYAQFCAVPAGQVLPVPRGYDALHAAALPETCFTVWANLFDIGQLRAGETLLIHGGSSGIGVTATKLAKAFGARAIVTAGSDDKCAACLRFGADHAINYREQSFEEEVRRLTGKRGVDVILDIVGGRYAAANIRSLAPHGRLLLIGFLGGNVADGIDLARILSRRLVVTGSAMRPRSSAEKAAIASGLRDKVWPLLEAGQCGPEIFASFDLAAAAEAHRLMESSAHIGKIMLRVAA